MSKEERKAAREARKTQKKITKNMKETGRKQSDGLEVDSSGEVVYNPSRDERENKAP